MVVQLSILVGNVESLLAAGYLNIEIHRSIDKANSYEPVTTPVAGAASLLSLPAATTFRMGGRLLRIRVDGGPLRDIEFNTVVPYWTQAQVAARINEVVAGVASVVDGKHVKITSPTTGRSSSIQVDYCDAQDLGFSGGQGAVGTAAHIALASGTLVYAFTDPDGAADHLYKWRFTKAVGDPSEFSEPVLPAEIPAVNASDLSVCVARFLGIDGRPRKTRIIVGVPETPINKNGMFVGEEAPSIYDSDDNGYLQFTLVRGLKVRVAIEGSLYIREFVVPDAPTFDLITTMATAPDTFTVQTLPPLATRRSM